MTRPVFSEIAHGPWGEYVIEWYCDPPPIGVEYIVIRDEGYGGPVRRIYEIELVPGIHRPEGT